MTEAAADLFARHREPAAFARAYLQHVTAVLERLDPEEIAALVELLLDTRERGARILLIGNGGSAATAGHLANDLSVGSRSWDKPFRAQSLADNTATLTAIANDYGYEHVFTKQLQAQMEEGDLVIAISASGNSPNIVAAVEWANDNGGRTAGLTGFDGGALRRLAHVCIHVDTHDGDYGPVEDAHMVLDHLISTYLFRACAERASAGLEA